MSIYLLSPDMHKDSIHLPMIDFTLSSVTLDFGACDILMFTSKQAVKSAEALSPKWKNIPCLAIGEATAKIIESLGGTVLHRPKSFYAKTLSLDIISKFKDKNILYLRPKVVSFDSKSFLAKAGLRLQEQIIYETSCLQYEPQDKPSKNAIIIFTSPSTVKCFLKNFDWDETYIAVVIGEATKAYLPAYARYEVADRPLISACIEKASLLKES
ncbi:MAG: uroporphyrinogen-III synthase [Epsilonproteobacteria bacterium]|nr:MAG: uroporphyrinogen-III synthase [Campylobacterota bacterium]